MRQRSTRAGQRPRSSRLGERGCERHLPPPANAALIRETTASRAYCARTRCRAAAPIRPACSSSDRRAPHASASPAASFRRTISDSPTKSRPMCMSSIFHSTDGSWKARPHGSAPQLTDPSVLDARQLRECLSVGPTDRRVASTQLRGSPWNTANRRQGVAIGGRLSRDVGQIRKETAAPGARRSLGSASHMASRALGGSRRRAHRPCKGGKSGWPPGRAYGDGSLMGTAVSLPLARR